MPMGSKSGVGRSGIAGPGARHGAGRMEASAGKARRYVHRDRDARPWRRTRQAQANTGSVFPPLSNAPETLSAESVGYGSGRVRHTVREFAALEPPYIPSHPAPDVRDQFKFPEEFPEGPYGLRPERPMMEANGRWHRGQRSISGEADSFTFETYRYDLDYDPVVGSVGDEPPPKAARKVPGEAPSDAGQRLTGDPR